MRFPIYQVDAFTDRVFYGNPAAVCPLDAWLPDDVMQSIALENNLPETAFFVARGRDYELRWFTPAAEVALCGHATLASAYVVFNHLHRDAREVTFYSRSGPLVVTREQEKLVMDLPALDYASIEPPDELVRGLAPGPAAVYRSMDYLVVYDREEQILSIRPDQGLLMGLDLRGVIVTAKGRDVDFVSRFFAPKLSIPEDPVTGSAHCVLVPFWAAHVGRDVLRARQYSPRLGERLGIDLECERRGNRVLLGGTATLFLVGTIQVPDSILSARSGEPA